MKDERLYLGHISDAINDIEEYASIGREVFMADRMRQDAVIRKLEVIGEAVKQLTDATKQRRPEIPWKQIAGMRDRLTHGYFGVDLSLVWRVVERDLQPLKRAFTRCSRTIQVKIPNLRRTGRRTVWASTASAWLASRRYACGYGCRTICTPP